jgi:hypothetical protein
MSFTRLRGAWFAGDDELYMAASREDGSPAPIKKVNPNGETGADTWSPTFKSDPGSTILDTHLGGPVLFVLEQPAIYVYPNGHIGYPSQPIRSKLRALDLKGGRELWSRHWDRDLPVPYADPRGKRVSLGWRATTSGGEALAKHYPTLKKTDRWGQANDKRFAFRGARSRVRQERWRSSGPGGCGTGELRLCVLCR